jgi:protocatechuate 3,4-dioxygenase, beta subunit
MLGGHPPQCDVYHLIIQFICDRNHQTILRTEEIMIENGSFARRDLLKISATFAAMGAMSPVKLALAQSKLRRTPDQILGPFYPAMKTADLSGDLTRVPGHTGRAKGQILNVMGRVLNIKGEPVRGAKLEIWQANSYGRYVHLADRNPAPLDLNFEGFALLKTDSDGRYKFKTVKPGAYPIGSSAPDVMRPPHIHFRLKGREDELVTQMYFDGEPLNEKDRWLQSALPGTTDLLIAKLLPPPSDLEPNSQLAIFDIVTLRG